MTASTCPRPNADRIAKQNAKWLRKQLRGAITFNDGDPLSVAYERWERELEDAVNSESDLVGVIASDEARAAWVGFHREYIDQMRRKQDVDWGQQRVQDAYKALRREIQYREHVPANDPWDIDVFRGAIRVVVRQSPAEAIAAAQFIARNLSAEELNSMADAPIHPFLAERVGPAVPKEWVLDLMKMVAVLGDQGRALIECAAEGKLAAVMEPMNWLLARAQEAKGGA